MFGSRGNRDSSVDPLWRGILPITRFAAVQVLVQGLGFLAGFILVRVLDKHDYALYTLAIGGMNMLAILSNGGIIDTAISIGGRNWQDSQHLGQVVASARHLRKRLVALSVPPILAILGWFLMRNGASALETILLSTTAFLAAYLQNSTGLLSVVLRLRGDIRQLQILDLAGSLLRALLILILFFVLDAESAMLIAAAGATLPYLLAQRRVADLIEDGAAASSEIITKIAAVVRRQWVNDVAFIFQGQITLLLIGAFGGSESVANFGALGRIAALFAIISSVLQSVILPRYARVQDPGRLRHLYSGILCGSILVTAIPIAIAILLPQPLLWILGEKYANLPRELVLVLMNAGAGSIAFTAWSLNSVRAWVVPAWISIPAIFGAQAVLMATIGVATMNQMLWVGIGWNVFATLFHAAATLFFSRGFRYV